jgi:hypothetical protein
MYQQLNSNCCIRYKHTLFPFHIGHCWLKPHTLSGEQFVVQSLALVKVAQEQHEFMHAGPFPHARPLGKQSVGLDDTLGEVLRLGFDEVLGIDEELGLDDSLGDELELGFEEVLGLDDALGEVLSLGFDEVLGFDEELGIILVLGFDD